MKRFPITLPSMLAGRRSGQPSRATLSTTTHTQKSGARKLTEAEQRLLDRKVDEARQQARADLNHRYATICRLCDRLEQPHLATQLIEQGATIEQAVNRLCGHATGSARFPSNDHQ